MLSPLASAGKDSRWSAVNGDLEPGIPSDTNARLTANVGDTSAGTRPAPPPAIRQTRSATATAP